MWPAFAFITASFFVIGGAAAGGWTSYAPLSAIPEAAPGSGLGQSFWLIAIVCVGISSMLGSINYLTTIISGIRKLPKAPARIGMITKKTMIVPCIVTSIG